MSASDGIFDVEETRFGFRWGPMNIERVASDLKFGVVVHVMTPTGKALEVRVSPAGKVITSHRVDYR